MNYYEQLVGSRIKAKRLTKGMNQEELAGRVGTDQSRVSRWENGHALPDAEFRPALLKALEFSEAQLFGLEQIQAPATPAPETVAEMSIADLKSMFREFAEVQGAWDRAEGPSRAVALFFLDPTEARRLKILEALRIPDHLRLVQKRFDDIQAALPSRKSKQ